MPIYSCPEPGCIRSLLVADHEVLHEGPFVRPEDVVIDGKLVVREPGELIASGSDLLRVEALKAAIHVHPQGHPYPKAVIYDAERFLDWLRAEPLPEVAAPDDPESHGHGGVEAVWHVHEGGHRVHEHAWSAAPVVDTTRHPSIDPTQGGTQ